MLRLDYPEIFRIILENYSLDTTVDIRLLEGNIDGIVRFKLFLPETRKGDTELIVTTLMEKLDFSSSKNKFCDGFNQ